MSGVITGNPPRTDAQWSRDVSQQLKQIQQSQVSRIGGWTLSDQGGSLVATKMGAAPISLSDTADGAAVSGQTVTALLASADGATSVTDTTFLGNLEKFFADLNFTSPTFNPADAAKLLITNILKPTGLLSDLPSLIQSITGIAGGGLPDLANWAQLVPLLTNPIGAGGKLLSEIIPGINAASLFGSIPAGLLGVVPVGALSSVAPNQLKNGNFTADAIMSPSRDWTVDMTTSRTADGSGAALVVADGTLHALRTGANPSDKIPVGAGQNVTAVGYIRHQGAVAGSGGAPVILQIVPFSGTAGDIELAPVTIATYTPGAPDVAWPGKQISGSWPVPAGVTFVQGRLMLTEQALQGNWWGDDFDVAPASDYTAIPGLPPILQALDGKTNSIMDGIASAASGFPIVGAGIEGMIAALKMFNPFNMIGSLGSASAAGDFFGIVGHLIDAVKNQPAGTTTNGSLPQLYAAMNARLNNTTGSDETHFYDTTTVIPINTWTNQIDALGVGRGQSGQDALILDFDGQGGQPGKINMTTWVRGTHFDAGTGNVTVTTNADGSVVISIPAGTSTAAHSITCAPGSGTQSPHFGTGSMGIGNQPVTYNQKPYAFGGNQNTPGAAGLGPGGGGAGGSSGLAPIGGIIGGNGWLQKGGPGAPGGAYVRQIATAITGATTGADTTPPAGGTGTFVSASLTSITVRHTGAVDA